MQIRLSVLAARDGGPSARTHAADVLVTAPAGTSLGAVAVALAGAVGARSGARGRSATHVHLYSGDQRLDERAVLGHPPLVDGAVLRLDEPDPDHVPELDAAGSPAELRVVGGPDCGGIHLLHVGRVRVGRSADADVPLDDPDVSRFHLALEVSADGRVSVADLGSTNGTTLDGLPVGADPYPVPPGALIGLGESTLQIAPGRAAARADLLPDGQGLVQVAPILAAAPAGPGGPTATGTGAEPAPAPRPLGARARGLLVRKGERLLRGRAEPAAAPAPVPGPGATPPHGLRLPPSRPLPPVDPTRWPDPAELLHTALGPGPRLWERGADHPDALSLRLGTVGLPAVPVSFDLRATGSLGLTGPRPRLTGLARSLLAQLAVLHGPNVLELVLVAADPAHPVQQRAETWSWLYWLPQLRPGHGQPCRLLTALDPAQALARVTELGTTVGLTAPGSAGAAPSASATPGTGAEGAAAHRAAAAGPTASGRGADRAGSGPAAQVPAQPLAASRATAPTAATPDSAGLSATTAAGPRHPRAGGPLTVLVVDGDPGSPAARSALDLLLAHGPARGVHVVCLAERPELLPHGCAATAAVSGEVGTLLTLERPALRPTDPAAPTGGQHRAAPEHELLEGIALDAVAPAWAERLARALAPLREPDGNHRPGRGVLPEAPRLLELLGLDLVTPAKLSSRWAELQVASGQLPSALIGADRDGPCGLDLTDHLLIGGAPGSGRTELLRTLVASLAVAERPDRLGILLIEGRAPSDPADGLRPCVELPHVADHVDGTDPARLLHTARSLLAELDRRDTLLEGRSFASWHAERALARFAAPRRPADDHGGGHARGQDHGRPQPPTGPLAVATTPPPHLLVVVDDHDELLAPGAERAALAAALDAVALRGPRLGVHLAVATGRPDRSSGSDLDEAAQLRIALRTDDARLSALLIHVEDAAALADDRPGRGYLRDPDGGVTAFQAARVSGRIPRTATLRPTVVPLDWAAMGDPPARRPVRELGNGPTDLALLASAMQRAESQPVSP
ncbi:FHA domain-containing protein [Streptacidiphilus sp. EB129]|uniref:FHA domain-containing protein n=1 Tax=Streptacidiphilus sp. EB129 TaxID=3156262 RepID=UPI0035135916